MSGTRPTNDEVAQMKVLNDMGHTPNAIGRQLSRDPKTVRAYLSTEAYLNPEIQKMVEVIKSKELSDLHLIGGKARAALHGYLDRVLAAENNPNPVAIVAIQDRSFQQRRLLEGESTHNISVKSVVASIQAELLEIQKKKLELLMEPPDGD